MYAWLKPAAAAAVAIAVAQAAAVVAPTLRDAWFARPTAWLAGFHFGATCSALRDGFLLARIGCEPLLVTTACSGYDFFALLVAVATFAIVSRPGPAGKQRWSVSLLALYVVAIVANASRVVAVAHVDLFAATMMPPSTLHALHRVAGLAVFLPVMMFVYMLLERKGLDELYFHRS